MNGTAAKVMASVVSSWMLLAGGCIPASLRTFPINSSADATVPGDTILGSNPLGADQVFPADAVSKALAQSISQTFSTEGINKAAVDSLKLTALHVEVLDPNEKDTQARGLGFLSKMRFQLVAGQLAPVDVAASADGAFDGDPGPVGYDFPVTNAELKPLLDAGDQLQMTADVEPKRAPRYETKLRFTVTLTVVANVLGALTGKQ